MKRNFINIILCCFSIQFVPAQDFGPFPKIDKVKLLNDLELLHQGLDRFHSGMYWYTPKDSVYSAFEAVRDKLTKDLNVLEFHKLIAPLVALSREDHTNIYRPQIIKETINKEISLFPLKTVFLGKNLHCVLNGSALNLDEIALEGKQIERINGETPKSIVNKIGNFFASDGYIRSVKYSDLKDFNFSTHYFFYYGEVDEFVVKFKNIEAPIILKAQKSSAIREHLKTRYVTAKKDEKKEVLEFKVINESVAYLGIHTFSNDDIRDYSKDKKLSIFLEKSFRSIQAQNIPNVVVDVSQNGGGSEGNEGLLYAYFGKNYQKYKKVRTKTQKAVLDNGTDKAIKLKAYGPLERLLTNKKMEDGSLERRTSFGKGLMAYKKAPKHKFNGQTFVIISPVTYSGSSEFSNMMYSQGLATFVGQETGGGYLGNTSGYSKALVLPHSEIKITIPALQFVMNVENKLPFGRGVIPHHEVIPTFEEYSKGENASLNYILENLIQQ